MPNAYTFHSEYVLLRMLKILFFELVFGKAMYLMKTRVYGDLRRIGRPRLQVALMHQLVKRVALLIRQTHVVGRIPLGTTVLKVGERHAAYGRE